MKNYEKVQELKFSTGDKVTSFADLLTEDQRAQLVARSSNPPKKSPPLRARDFEFVLPLTPRTGRSFQKCLICKSKSKDAKKLYESVLWCAIYGSSHFTVFIWYLLFNLFSKRITNDKSSLALIKILRLTTTSQEGLELRHHIKPVRTIVMMALRDKDKAVRYCKKLEDELGVKLPHEAPVLSELFELSLKTRKFKKTPAKTYIGKGYNDKGTLPKDSKEEPSPGEDYSLPENDIFVDLLDSSSEVLAFCESYDSKKRKKLLDKISKDLE